MFCSIYLMVSLLMNIVAMVSTIVQPAECNMAKKPNIRYLNITKLKGVWYERAVTGFLPSFANVKNYLLVIGSSRKGGQTQLRMDFVRSFRDQVGCKVFKWICNLNESTCTEEGNEHVFQIVAIKYNSAFAVWSESVEDGETYKILSIFTRDPLNLPDMTRLELKLKKFCGEQAADPTSSFYVRKFSYPNNTCEG